MRLASAILAILTTTAVSNTVAQPIFDPRERVFDEKKGKGVFVNKLTSFEMGCYNEKDPSSLEQGGAKGRSYRGLVSYTASGRTCKNWLSDNKWSGAAETATPDREEDGIMKWGNGLGNHNYCRNPNTDSLDGFDKPWCFTLDPKRPKEVCNIPKCEDQDGAKSPEYWWSEASNLASKMKEGMSPDEPAPCICKMSRGAFGKDISRDFYGEKETFASEGGDGPRVRPEEDDRPLGFLQNSRIGRTKDGRPCTCGH